jgi:hypothetical protein
VVQVEQPLVTPIDGQTKADGGALVVDEPEQVVKTEQGDSNKLEDVVPLSKKDKKKKKKAARASATE